MSEANTPYDPNAAEGENPNRGEQYLSKRDVKGIAIGLVVVGVILSPIYMYGVRQSENARCRQNLKAIYEAMSLYATEKDDRFPPLFRTGDSDGPGLGSTGLPYAWASDIHQYMNQRATFRCPSAKSEEVTKVEHPNDSKLLLELTYGMFAPYGGYLRSALPSSEVVLLGETSNHGAQESYNPVPYLDGSGQPIAFDGMTIGFSDDNLFPSKQTKTVTRLAYRQTKDGVFSDEKPGRHPSGLNFITASGSLLVLPGSAAQVKLREGLPQSPWEIPSNFGRRP